MCAPFFVLTWATIHCYSLITGGTAVGIPVWWCVGIKHSYIKSISYRKHELEKKRQYEQRVREVEHASFTPLVLSATGGMANQATVFYKRLTTLLALKWDQPYSSTMAWLQSRPTFSLLRSAIQSIRGARSCCGRAARVTNPPTDLATSELNRFWTLVH